MIEYAIQYIEEKDKFDLENELYCFIKLFGVLPGGLKKRLKKSIEIGISQVIEYERNNWGKYVPMPLDFVPDPQQERFRVKCSKIEENLDYYIELIEINGELICPSGETVFIREV